MGENGIIKQAINAKIASEEADLWERIQIILMEYVGEDLDKNDFVNKVNEKFKSENLNAKIGLTSNGYAITYGKNNRKIALLDWNLQVDGEVIAALEGKPEDWQYDVKEDGTIKLTEYNKPKEGEIQIPNIIDGKFVTELGEIFSTQDITKVNIPNGLEKIDDSAFQECLSLECEIKFPNSLKEIGSYAFYGCTKITGDLNIIVQQKIKMGKNVFGKCSKMTGDIQALINTLDENTETIEEGQFSGFSGVTGKLILPLRIKKIEDNAFYGCNNIEEIKFEAGSELQTIGNNAFYKCNNAKNILTIPDGVISIGENAFYDCEKLTGLVLGNELTEIGQYAFYNCIGISGTITIPGKLAEIKNYTFYNNGMTKVEFAARSTENKIINIKQYSFSYCKKLLEISISSSDINLDYHSFGDCALLENIYGAEFIKTIGDRSFIDCATLNVDFSGVETIEPYAFEGCKKLSILPSSPYLKSIGEHAFVIDPGDQLTGDIIEYLQNSSVTFVGTCAFQGNKKLIGNCPEILYNKLHNKITLGTSPFLGTGVTKVRIFDLSEKTIIKDYEFEGVTKFQDSNGNEVKEIVISQNITSIGSKAFYGCPSITKVELPNSVISIGASCFANCLSLNSVTLPENSSYVGLSDDIFADCGNLKNIKLPSQVTILGAGSFARSGLETIDIRNITSLGESAFWRCYNLENIEFGKNITNIGTNCFGWTTGLNINITIPDTVTNFGAGVFQYSGVKGITFGSGIKNIGTDMCVECNFLTTIKFNSDIGMIGNNAFKNCSKLNSVTLTWSVLTSIGTNAFNNCSSLEGTITLSRNCVYNKENTFENCPLIIKKI